LISATIGKNKWPVYLPEHAESDTGLNIYEVLESINENLISSDIVVADAGSPSYACPTNLKARSTGQFIFNPSQADMGWALPASIGVSLNAIDRYTIAIIGDGSFYSNMQELAVIKYHGLPIRIFVLNNGGYLSIKNTQTKYFDGRIYGVNEKTGLYFADLKKIADTFEIGYEKIGNRNELKENCNIYMHTPGPAIIEVMCQVDQEILPAQSFKILEDGTRVQASLHDMHPFISDEEMKNEWPK